ncbi:MAG: 50S ribosomal protein L9 [Clostridia bacterium]|nr:50S ribosomal protein L9 [Clostridia bacterium]
MEVILTQDVKGQGKKGDLIKVSDGYARNFLFPKKLATPATKDAINAMKGQKDAVAYHKQQELESAKALAEKINAVTVVLKAKCGENGKLFGSITSSDIAQELKMQHHIVVDKKKIALDEPIKSICAIKVKIKLHSQVAAELSVNVTDIK